MYLLDPYNQSTHVLICPFNVLACILNFSEPLGKSAQYKSSYCTVLHGPTRPIGVIDIRRGG